MDKAKLLKPRGVWPEAEVEVEGGTVKVRALSRGQALNLRALAEKPEVFDRMTLVYGMADPKLTADEAKQWQDNSLPDEIENVTNKIWELSKVFEGAEKRGVQGAGD